MTSPPTAPDQPAPTKRFHDLDALRAFAMLLGIVLHAAISFMPMPIWAAQDINQSPKVYETLLHVVHGFRMQLFFLVSGFPSLPCYLTQKCGITR